MRSELIKSGRYKIELRATYIASGIGYEGNRVTPFGPKVQLDLFDGKPYSKEYYDEIHTLSEIKQ